MRILVVDDNETVAFILQMVFEAAGHVVKTARDGCQGYFAYLSFGADLVITDLETPCQSGPEMMRKIRQHDPHVRTVYMSGGTEEYHELLEEESRQYGVTFLRKPFSRMELMRAVAEADRRTGR
ncbi:MAG: response regulator [Deltaproteobacteria bacterium]|nr:response regulator [Deltaproteobacteria bacterium]